MANELAAQFEPGLDATVSLMQLGAVVASGIAAAESGAVPSIYVASVPPGTAAGLYAVLFLSGDVVMAHGWLDWTGAAERVVASQASVTAIPTTPLLASGYTAPDNAGVSTLLGRVTGAVPLAADWTPTRAAYLDAAISSVGGGGGGSDPWLDVVPGAYPVGSAGYTLGKLNAVAAAGPVVVIPGPPADSSMCRLYGYFETVTNAPAAGLTVSITLVGATPIHSTKTLAGLSTTAMTDSAGRLSDGANPWIDVQRNDMLGPATNTQYRITCERAGINVLVTLDSESADLMALAFP